MPGDEHADEVHVPEMGSLRFLTASLDLGRRSANAAIKMTIAPKASKARRASHSILLGNQFPDQYVILIYGSVAKFVC